jgi:flagellar motor switch protein FliN/FliY
MERPQPNLDIVLNVVLGVRVELGRCTMRVSEILALGAGSLVALDRAAGAPVDLYVNEKRVAEGELVALDDRYGVRLVRVFGAERAAGPEREAGL